MEKLAKTLWVKNNEGNIPPKIHNAVRLLEMSNIDIENDQVDFLNELNTYNIEARYPDYKGKLSKICNERYTEAMIIKMKKVKLCLLNKLQ